MSQYYVSVGTSPVDSKPYASLSLYDNQTSRSGDPVLYWITWDDDTSVSDVLYSYIRGDLPAFALADWIQENPNHRSSEYRDEERKQLLLDTLRNSS